MAGQVDLAVLADDPALGVDQDRGVEPAGSAALDGLFRIAEIKADAELGSQVEQRLHGRIRHLGFEERVDLRLVRHVPAGKEGGQRQLREDDQPCAGSVGPVHQGHQALDHGCPRIGAGDRTELTAGEEKRALHGDRCPPIA